jgi:thiaminase
VSQLHRLTSGGFRRVRRHRIRFLGQDDAMGTPGSDTPSARLREQNAAEWARGLAHPLIVDTADDSISDAHFTRWIVITTHFLRTYRRFLMVMGTLAPDTRASRLLFQGVQEMDEEMRRTGEFAAAHAVELDAPPSPLSMEYSSYCMASVGQGWARGLVVAFGVESLHFDAWTRARETAVPGARYWEFIDMWSSGYQREFVAGVSSLVDRLELTPELERIFRTTVRLELAGWDEACGLAAPGDG